MLRRVVVFSRDMKILVLNSGSSSLKYKLILMPEERVHAWGMVERIGEPDGKSVLKHRLDNGGTLEKEIDCKDHRQALEKVLETIVDARNGCISSVEEIGAVGHRVVHGKDIFNGPTLVSEDDIKRMKDLIELAPLHMPANITCIEACREILPGTPQVAHFDTSFFQSMPRHAYMYPVPMEWHEKHGVRRYGFHGTSHQYVTEAASDMLGIPPGELKVITAHLGNGSSITAYAKGRVLDTSMGFTPLEGLMMGTRVGYLDPAVIPYMMSKTGASVEEIERILNNESGLEAISGVGRDMRNILKAREEGNENAELAFRMFVHALLKYVGAYFFEMGGADAIVFTGGVGENSPEVRGELFKNLDRVGIVVDERKNMETVAGKRGFINADSSTVKILVIPTDEELMIARETRKIIEFSN